jgi:hypothetical protein
LLSIFHFWRHRAQTNACTTATTTTTTTGSKKKKQEKDFSSRPIPLFLPSFLPFLSFLPFFFLFFSVEATKKKGASGRQAIWRPDPSSPHPQQQQQHEQEGTRGPGRHTQQQQQQKTLSRDGTENEEERRSKPWQQQSTVYPQGRRWSMLSARQCARGSAKRTLTLDDEERREEG